MIDWLNPSEEMLAGLQAGREEMQNEIDCPDCGGEKILYCHADRDGDCTWKYCPQAISRESHCKLDKYLDEDEEYHKCPNCKDGKIKVYTQEELDKEIKKLRDVLDKIILVREEEMWDKTKIDRMVYLAKQALKTGQQEKSNV